MGIAVLLKEKSLVHRKGGPYFCDIKQIRKKIFITVKIKVNRNCFIKLHRMEE
jgi:hypothetical protein